MKESKFQLAVTNQEYDFVIDEMTQRCLDVGKISLDKQLRELYPDNQALEDHLFSKGETRVEYAITYVMADLRMILGKLRRGRN